MTKLKSYGLIYPVKAENIGLAKERRTKMVSKHLKKK